MRRLTIATCALSVLLLGSVSLWASINGSISGVVSDSSGALVNGANVTATNTETGVQTSVNTDYRGFYNFPALQIGPYTVDAKQKGLKTVSQNGLVIDSNSGIQ